MTPDENRSASTPATADIVLHEQELHVAVARRPYEQVVLRRRIVSEVRQVQVTVQREELEVVRLPLNPDQAQDTGSQGETEAPVVIVLSEQVPVVELETRAYEKVTVTVEQVTEERTVHEQVSREQAEVIREPV